MPKTGDNIYKRKDGRWEGRFIKGYSADKKAKYGYIYAKTYSELKKKMLAEHKMDVIDCTYSSSTFSDLAHKWLHSVKLKVKRSTYSEYANILNQHILPHIGGYKLKYLSNNVIETFTNEKLSSGRLDGSGGLSAKTVRDILSVINAVISFGEAEKYIPPDSLSVSYPKYTPKETRVFSKIEQAKLESVLSEGIDIYKVGVLVCLYTGIRIGEICALKWGDISLTEKTLTVRRTIQRIKNTETNRTPKTYIIVDTPKTKYSLRAIPIPSFLISELQRFAVRNEKAYFLSKSETEFIEPRRYQNYFKSYLKAGSLEDAGFHSLRHTFATRCVESGFDIKSLSEILGHANVNITLSRYVHSSFEQKRKNMDNLELILFQSPSI